MINEEKRIVEANIDEIEFENIHLGNGMEIDNSGAKSLFFYVQEILKREGTNEHLTIKERLAVVNKNKGKI